MIELYDYQKEAVRKLRSGSILCGGVGSGKSATALHYYMHNEFPKSLYIITTAKKRDSLEWDKELANYLLSVHEEASKGKVVIDSWNNIKKYLKVTDAFFIFDEQKVSGYGTWVRAFIKITRYNHWILLSATPGDTWLDYIPVFVANGFYRNKTDFMTQHVVQAPTPFFKVDHYVGCKKLVKHKNDILVTMNYRRKADTSIQEIQCQYDKDLYMKTLKDRWNSYTNAPIKNVSELCMTLRKITNSDRSKMTTLEDILTRNSRVIVFYNFIYELEAIRALCSRLMIPAYEWNGFKHDPIPDSKKWVYIVQYSSGSEGWNCISTNIVVFYSLPYSYREVAQAAGRIDRLNTPYTKLFYYALTSKAPIDRAIIACLKDKRTFNERNFIGAKQ